jgi:hypothetical protein
MARRLLFRARLAEQDKTHPGYAAKFRRLSKLMRAAAGGEEVVPHLEPDGFIDHLLKNGKLLQPAAVVMKRMKASDCHGNAATLFRAGKGVIATGYALDADGLWRQHSWVLDKKDRVIETTVRRVAYYGIVCDETGSGVVADLFLGATTKKKNGGH